MSNVQIKISTQTDVPPQLRSGELAYSYKSDKLFIGPPGNYNDPPSSNVVELLSADRYISQDIQEGVDDYSPSVDAVFKALQEVNNTISIEYNSGTNSNPDVKTVQFDGNLNVQTDPNNPDKILVAAKPYWGNVDINDNINAIIPQQEGYDNLKFIDGQAILFSADQNKIKVSANIDDNDANGSPNKLWSSQKVREAISATTGILPDGNNDFTGINTFPDLDILNIDPTSKQVINAGSVKGYVGTVATQILNGLSLVKYVFDSPSMNWMVTHNKNSTIFQYDILDQYGNKMMAPINIIDNNNFIIELTEAMIGSVLLRF